MEHYCGNYSSVAEHWWPVLDLILSNCFFCVFPSLILSCFENDYLWFDNHFVTHVHIPYGSLLNIVLTAIMSEKSCFSGIIKAKSWMLMVATTNIKPSTANTIARRRFSLLIT